MKTIQIDDQLHEYLEKHIQGFGDTPAAVIRRLIGVETLTAKPKSTKAALPTNPRLRRAAGSKRPRANLKDLVQIGNLQEGQKLHLRDYQGNQIGDVVAKISGDKLHYAGDDYSMTALAKKHLQRSGYRGDAYRGPSFWYTDKGQSVTDLWDEYLEAGLNRASA